MPPPQWTQSQTPNGVECNGHRATMSNVRPTIYHARHMASRHATPNRSRQNPPNGGRHLAGGAFAAPAGLVRSGSQSADNACRMLFVVSHPATHFRAMPDSAVQHPDNTLHTLSHRADFSIRYSRPVAARNHLRGRLCVGIAQRVRIKGACETRTPPRRPQHSRPEHCESQPCMAAATSRQANLVRAAKLLDSRRRSGRMR